jgi:hypothetical protein
MILSLKSVTLDAPLNQTGECVLLAELILPRPSIAKKSALKDCRVTKGKRSFVREPFYEKGLFKEKVDGPFGVRVSLSRPLKHPELNQFLRQLLGTGLESSADLLSAPSLSPLTIFNDVVEEAAEQIADRLTASETFIAIGGIDLDSETLSAGPVHIPLKLQESIRRSEGPVGPKARETRKTTAKRYKKGSIVGELVFDLSV